ncbi:MAG: hypothetical protein HC838_13220 [Spirulinaceae cyanobacterium RM2_2_10]|nr:hypothetical protein [Spirulinaceae cyanobacterium SM2_1_0]NJO20804.1 hypothetical protein [Spirulinaceae cyanobacterium RM2_2_10]
MGGLLSFLVGAAVVAVYVGGIVKFWRGYQRTNFQPGFVNRALLAALWPALLVVNKSYRQNFQKALKGR